MSCERRGIFGPIVLSSETVAELERILGRKFQHARWDRLLDVGPVQPKPMELPPSKILYMNYRYGRTPKSSG